MKLTILTPTFNRSNNLMQLYVSLTKQSNLDFQWLIVDDGSTDETEYTVKEMIEEGVIDITYVKKKNGGKHTALNYSHRYIKGDYLIIVDSDDYLIKNAVDIIYKYWKKYADSKRIGAITFMKGFPNGKPFARAFDNEEEIANFISFRINREMRGDYCEVIRSGIFKRYFFPEYENERYVPEGNLWLWLSRKYDMVFVNKIIYMCEYLDGGLTKQGRKLRINNPLGQMYDAKMLYTTEGVCAKRRIKAAWLYICYGLFANKQIKDIVLDSDRIPLIIMSFPFGFLLHIIWKKKYVK